MGEIAAVAIMRAIMALVNGTRLGPYEIQAAIGAGGMGEVYRARDTRLGRDVAVKVLPAIFSADADRLRRFEQEARTAGALNHPNILVIYDIGTHEGAPYLVSELLEGGTLREAMRGGLLPLRKALDVAKQTANGVAAAYEKGIVHRDLKPENIFVTHDGRVKILDFGLAKLTEGDKPTKSDSESPTLTAKAAGQTASGQILGTAGYMSPEQVRGKLVDGRSDIFSLGAILYEMLSGQRAFRRESAADTMAAILREDPPDMSNEQKRIPAGADRVVRHCLEKNPAERFQSARDLAFDLEALSGVSATSAGSVIAAGWLPRNWLMPLATGALLLLAGGVGGWLYRRGAGSTSLPSYHQLTFERGLIYAARFAPDGRSIIYSASWKGQPLQLYSTMPDSPESRPLNLSDSTLFAVSPSEMAISLGCKEMFIAVCEGTLALAPVSGGAPREVAENVSSADWTADGSEMAIIRHVGGKFRVEFPLGKMIYESDYRLSLMRVSPRGDMLAFAEYEDPVGDSGHVVILDRKGKKITQSRSFPSLEGVAWHPSGEEVWFAATENDAWADELHGLRFKGKDRVILRLPGMLRVHDISRDGRILLSRDTWTTGMQFRGPADARERDLSWLDGPITADLSPDGTRLTFTEVGWSSGGWYLAYARKTDGSPPVRLGEGARPVFSPEGKWVLASQVTLKTHAKLILLPTGPGETRSLNPGGIQQFTSYGWLPDGKEVYFSGNDGHGWRFYIQDTEGGLPRPITPGISDRLPYYECHRISPDGKLIFARDTNGKAWFYPLAGGEPKAAPGWSPDDIWITWSADGRSTYAYHDQRTFVAVYRLDVATGRRSLVATLAPNDAAGVTSFISVALTPDGKSYAYSFDRTLSELFLVDGVK
jgi:eukaryotic-like serine/threonine-protein kinase